MVGYHRETHHFSEGKIHERSYRPATHPIHFAADSPDKIIAALRGRYFSLRELYLENFMSRLNVILCHNLTLSVSEPDNAAAKQGQELRSEQTVIPLHEQHNLYFFFAS